MHSKSKMRSSFGSIEFDKGALNLYKTGVKLGYSCLCLAKALQMYHTFQPTALELKISSLSVGAGILDLCIFEETGQDDYEQIVCEFVKLLPDGADKNMVPNEEITAMKNEFTKLQIFILQTLKFDLNFGEAYTIAGRYLMILRDRSEFKYLRHTIVKFTWRCITHFYLNERCLLYSAEEIAIGCIDLACKAFFVDLPNWKQLLNITTKEPESIFDDLVFVLDVMH